MVWLTKKQEEIYTYIKERDWIIFSTLVGFWSRFWLYHSQKVINNLSSLVKKGYIKKLWHNKYAICKNTRMGINELRNKADKRDRMSEYFAKVIKIPQEE